MNLKNKKTVLNDEAAIYHHSENVSEKEKWKNMNGKKRWEYFKEYYLMKLVIIVICVGLAGSLLHTMLTPKPEVVLSVAIINGAMYYDTCEAVQLEFDELLALDAEKQETLFDMGYDLTAGSYETMQKFSMYNAVGELDITLMPQSVFESYAPAGFFSPVTEYLPADLYGELSEFLVESQRNDEDGNLVPGSETVYGIRIDSTWPYEGQNREEPVILSINLAPSNLENVERFLRFLFFPEEVK